IERRAYDYGRRLLSPARTSDRVTVSVPREAYGSTSTDSPAMPIGNCHLCGQRRELIDSHVWPKFAYKRYAADQSAGGSFVDLGKMRIHNLHEKRPWFCQDCDGVTLSQFEDYAAQFCRAIEARPTDPRPYNDRLLKFAVSISWRTSKLFLEDPGFKWAE